MKYRGMEIKHVPGDPDGLVYHLFGGSYKCRDLVTAREQVVYALKNYGGDPEVKAVRAARRVKVEAKRKKKERAGRSAFAGKYHVGDGLDGLRNLLPQF